MALSKIKGTVIADDAINADRIADGTVVASDLLDNTITGAKLATDIAINTSGNITTTGALTGTLATAAQPNITSVGTLTSFTSTGIDDNATSTAITIDSSENVGIGETSPLGKLHIKSADSGATPFSAGDEFVVEGGNGNIGMSFLSTGGNGQFIYFGDDADNNIGSIKYEHSDNHLQFITNASEAMRITSSGNVGIGTSSPSEKLDIRVSGNNIGNQRLLRLGTSDTGGAGETGIYLGAVSTVTPSRGALIAASHNYAANNACSLKFYTTSSGTDATDLALTLSGTRAFFSDGVANLPSISNSGDGDTGMWFPAEDTVGFSTGGSERMRIASNGDLMLGGTSRVSSEGIGLYIERAGGNDGAIIELKHTRNAGASRDFLRFFNSADGEAGAIVHSGETSVTYATSSDYRLKENVNYNFDATTRLKQLKPARFNFISEPEKTVDGFIAHEVSSIVPEAIIGEKDAINAKGKPSYQGIDQSKLVPLLVKTIQELEARITALENNQP